MYLQEVGRDGVNRTHVAQKSGPWGAFMNTVTELRFL
jgi:hypothetical protein